MMPELFYNHSNPYPDYCELGYAEMAKLMDYCFNADIRYEFSYKDKDNVEKGATLTFEYQNNEFYITFLPCFKGYWCGLLTVDVVINKERLLETWRCADDIIDLLK